MRNAVYSGMTFPAPKFAITYDLVYDDTVTDAPTVDERMRHYGCFPDVQNTIAQSPAPFMGLISPDNSIWKLSVDDLGVLSTSKVSS
jgi:hypothetical protein